MTNCYLLLLFAIVSIFLSRLLRGRIIVGISSKSEVLSQLRAKEDSYTVLKGWNITTALGERNPHFYKNGPWVHITVEYATSTANFCPLSLSNSSLQAFMTRQHISGKKAARKLLRFESLAELSNLYCTSHRKNRNTLIWPIDCLVNHDKNVSSGRNGSLSLFSLYL